MKLAIPIALIVMGGLVILAPVASHSYENTEIRRMLVDLSKNPGRVDLAQFRVSEYGQNDPLYFVFGAIMIGVGTFWGLLLHFGPATWRSSGLVRPARAGEEIQQPPSTLG